MADNFKTISDLDISFKEFMPGQIIQSAQFNDDMKDIEEKVNEVIGQHNGVASTVVDHLNNKNNPHEVTAHQVGTYTTTEIDEFIEDIKHGHLYDRSITNEVLADWSVDNRTIKDRTITASKVEDGFGNQIDISENIEITDRYTKNEVDELVRSKVGEGAYTKEEIDQKFEEFQSGQIIDRTISADKVTADFGDKIDISNNTSIINRYTKGEVDILIAKNGLPRDWGGISDEPTDIENRTGSLPVAGHMVAGQFTTPATSVLDIDVKENVEARGEYSSVGERLNGVDSQIKDIETRIDNIGGSEGNIQPITQVEPGESDMPKVFFYGSALPTTKNNVNLTMDYISNTAKFRSFVKLKCQGTSSMSYAKKNFTVAMYSDEARETKLKKDFKGWGAQSKFCLKANYVDTTHTRNISGARIAYDMVASRPDSPFKQQLLQCPRNGAIDGFPIKLYFNGEFYGIYTWNIPKDDWMFNMDKSNPNHVVLCAEKNTDGNSSLINSCQFRQLWTNGDGNDWSVEVGTYSQNMVDSFNRCINFVMTATDQEFHDNIGDYFDLYSLLDYYCFSYLTCHLDGLAKNMLMATYDGVIWGASLYDMDSIYGVSWNGANYVATNYQCPEQYQERFSALWPRIEKCFATELYARYLELRQGALSLSNIIKHVEEIYDVIPDRVFADEKAKWTNLPQVSTNTMTRFRNYMRDRAKYVDAQMQEIGTRVPCTGRVLRADTLSFTTTDTQTLSVVVSPDNCTDTVTWSVSPSGIATVNNGIVTPVSNGTCTITATCGTQSATCVVTVSGMSESGGDTPGGGNTGDYVTDSLYAYYDLTQLSTEATTVEDLSGNNNTFTVTRGTLSKDNLGGLIYSKDSNVLINSNSFNPQTAEASIEYTFKYTGMDNCNQPNKLDRWIWILYI